MKNPGTSIKEPWVLRASTVRKLKRLKAHTQQNIAAKALAQWLTHNEFLP